MQPREIKTEVEITEQKCEVETIRDIWGSRVSQTRCVDQATNPYLRLPSVGHPL
jgi:hypothetical protein